MSYLIVTFYKFVTLSELETKQAEILALCRKNEIQGTIILAKEGINGTIAGKDEAIATVLAHLRTIPGLTDLEHKKSTFQKSPFVRLKVKIKSEIVTLGMPEVNPTQQVGTYVAPQDWNQVISNPEVVLIDTR
ncbi:MAG: rhodanese-related sulfurtransferase, partial [Waterburya sp.]